MFLGGVDKKETFDYPAAVGAALKKFSLGNWGVRVQVDEKAEAAGEVRTAAEYLEADFTFSPVEMENRGLEPSAVVEHEVLHLCCLPLVLIVRQIIRQFVTDTRLRDYLEVRVDFEEHQVIERIHRGFRPGVQQRTGKLSSEGEE